jgi:hypothetical protein
MMRTLAWQLSPKGDVSGVPFTGGADEGTSTIFAQVIAEILSKRARRQHNNLLATVQGISKANIESGSGSGDALVTNAVVVEKIQKKSRGLARIFRKRDVLDDTTSSMV